MERGRPVETLVSQFVAYLDGRIDEVAVDRYAQADDGSVWYFGEDVFNYKDGVVADTEGTWLAGADGPPAMIMPADPQVGDVYRPENMPGFVFEEVTVKAVDETVNGPRGPVEGAIVVEELHQDGPARTRPSPPATASSSPAGGDVEALALAVPIDALSGPVPELEILASGSSTMAAKKQAWRNLQARRVPPRLKGVMDDALARQSAFDVAQTALDLQLQYRPPAEIDRARFDLWARRLTVDAKADNHTGATGDLVVLEWIRIESRTRSTPSTGLGSTPS